MEIYYELDDELFYSSRKKNEKIEQMGPKHPCWNYALEEVESLLQQAGRVYDKTTIESIAMNHSAWDQLIEEALVNNEIKTKQVRGRILMETVDRIRNGAESEMRIQKLFGDGTKIGE
jgi:hypothetical protein